MTNLLFSNGQGAMDGIAAEHAPCKERRASSSPREYRNADFQKELSVHMTPQVVASSGFQKPDRVHELNLVGYLLEKMHHGDRDAAARFLDHFGQRIRRRVHGRLRGYTRRIFDSQEIVSTVARRLDLLVHGGKLTARTEGELWALVFTIAENAAFDKARLCGRLCALESSAGAIKEQWQPSVTVMPERHNGAAVVNRAFSVLRDGIDREILSLWLQDTPHLITARLVGLSPAAVRKRWEVIKRRLRPVLTWE